MRVQTGLQRMEQVGVSAACASSCDRSQVVEEMTVKIVDHLEQQLY